MLLEIFIHTSKLEDLFSGKPVNCKINYADQYDVKLLINPNKYVIVKSNTGSNNIITIRKKKLIEKFWFKKK
jgi:hypothetical protein